jgi:sugar phosphate permease
MNQPAAASYRDPHRWVVFSVICLIYFFVYFHRVSTSVIVSDLLAAFNTNATAQGFTVGIEFSPRQAAGNVLPETAVLLGTVRTKVYF